jgi:hypothetical protein
VADKLDARPGVERRPTIFFFDPDYQNPEVHQASIGVDRQLGNDFAVAVNYLFVAGRKLQRTRDFNILAPVPTAIPVLGGDRSPSSSSRSRSSSRTSPASCASRARADPTTTA